MSTLLGKILFLIPSLSNWYNLKSLPLALLLVTVEKRPLCKAPHFATTSFEGVLGIQGNAVVWVNTIKNASETTLLSNRTQSPHGLEFGPDCEGTASTSAFFPWNFYYCAVKKPPLWCSMYKVTCAVCIIQFVKWVDVFAAN